MDLSALIFVALAVAWAAYLIPKALRIHEDDQRSRTVDRFSDSMRVLARREPVDSRRTALVAEAPVPGEEAAVARRRATARAARRRRRVLALLLLATLVVGVLAALAIVPVPYVAIPAGSLVTWLVVCRLTVRAERSRPVPRQAPRPVATAGPDEASGDDTEEVPAVTGADSTGDETAAPAPGTWDPVPVTLPTYVAKEASHRSVRTIDLDSTGVWTSGHSEADAELARRAEEEAAEAAESERADSEQATRRASGA